MWLGVFEKREQVRLALVSFLENSHWRVAQISRSGRPPLIAVENGKLDLCFQSAGRQPFAKAKSVNSGDRVFYAVSRYPSIYEVDP
jgi:hypothetical protein